MMAGFFSRVSGVVGRAIHDPGKEYRRLRLRFDISPVWQQLPEGVGVFLYSDDMLSARLLAGNFELPQRRLLGEILKPGMRFVDAGANLGVYTAIAAKVVGEHGRVYAFEPSKREWGRALKTVRANKLTNVELIRTALADRDGTVSLNVCDAACAAYNSLGSVTHVSAVGHVSHVEQVPSQSLDSFVGNKGLDGVDVVKIDVEGSEELVLLGGKKLFASEGAPVDFCELSDLTAPGLGSSAERVWDLLNSYGYSTYAISGDDASYKLSPCERAARTEYQDIVGVKPAHARFLPALREHFAGRAHPAEK
jgi:FkbM family methyltransferase